MPISIAKDAISMCEDPISTMKDAISMSEGPISIVHDAHFHRERCHFHA